MSLLPGESLQPVTCTHCGNVVAFIPGLDKKHVIIGECKHVIIGECTPCHFTHKEKDKDGARDGARSSGDLQSDGQESGLIHDRAGLSGVGDSSSSERFATVPADDGRTGLTQVFGTYPEFNELRQELGWDAAMEEWHKRYPSIEDVPADLPQIQKRQSEAPGKPEEVNQPGREGVSRRD